MSHHLQGDQRARIIPALAGGWVADAAALGLHWLYDSERIREVGGEHPEFLPPRADYFEGGFGYFAHEGKQVGDASHYAAATRVLTDSLVANQGRLVVRDYQRHFRSFFGPGGQWRGYIDNPTRVTLDNLGRIEQEAIDQAFADVTLELTDRQKRVLVQKVLPYTRRLTGDQLDAPVRKAISLTYPEEEIQDAGVLVARTIDGKLLAESGADDRQLPAVSKLPPLVACYYQTGELQQQVEAAVRVTNDSEEALGWARCAAELLKELYLGTSMADALSAAQALAPDSSKLAEGRAMASLDGVAAGDRFGRTCYLEEAMPVIFHILNHAGSFAEGVRANILCGGDSCGRAWIIGPALAARHGAGGETGIPLSWLARVSDAPQLYDDIERLVAMGGER